MKCEWDLADFWPSWHLTYVIEALTLLCQPRELALSMSSTRLLIDVPPMSLLKNTCSRILGSTAPRDVSFMRSCPKRLGACGRWRRRYSSKALRVLFWTAWIWTASESWSISVKIWDRKGLMMTSKFSRFETTSQKLLLFPSDREL